MPSRPKVTTVRPAKREFLEVRFWRKAVMTDASNMPCASNQTEAPMSAVNRLCNGRYPRFVGLSFPIVRFYVTLENELARDSLVGAEYASGPNALRLRRQSCHVLDVMPRTELSCGNAGEVRRGRDFLHAVHQRWRGLRLGHGGARLAKGRERVALEATTEPERQGMPG